MIAGVIQARLGSMRLPRKVLAGLAGEPMLARIVQRLRGCRGIDTIAVATTTDSGDDELVAYCHREGLAVARGPTDDIVGRLVGAGELVGADVVVRVWGDCPFVDPSLIDAVLTAMEANESTYGTNSLNAGRTYPAGLDFEVYHIDLLRRIAAETSDSFLREFPFEFVASLGDGIRCVYQRNDVDLSHLQLTVDYPDDLELARAIYERLLPSEKPFGFREVVEILAALDHRRVLPRNVEYQATKRDRK